MPMARLNAVRGGAEPHTLCINFVCSTFRLGYLCMGALSSLVAIETRQERRSIWMPRASWRCVGGWCCYAMRDLRPDTNEFTETRVGYVGRMRTSIATYGAMKFESVGYVHTFGPIRYY